MRIGIIGTGNVGAALTYRLGAAGHAVQIANTRGPDASAELARGSGATATTLDEVGRGADVLIMSIPFRRVPELKPLLDRLSPAVPVADTSNYYPHRDGSIDEIEDGMPDGVWVEQQLGRPVVRAWNALVQTTLTGKNRPKGTADRLAVPVAGTDPVAKQRVLELVDDTGFDAVDAGTADDTWRMQAGAPAYCTELDAALLRRALALADRDAVMVRRAAIMTIIDSWGTGGMRFDDVVALNRAAAGLHRLLNS